MVTAKRSSSDRTEAPAEARLELKLEKRERERCCPSQAEHKTNEETNKRRGALKQVAIVFRGRQQPLLPLATFVALAAAAAAAVAA